MAVLGEHLKAFVEYTKGGDKMKAKEYAEKYLASNDYQKELVEIGKMFLFEVDTMRKARNAQTMPALINILNELNAKWRTFTYAVNKKTPIGINYSGFENLIKMASPELFNKWKEK